MNTIKKGSSRARRLSGRLQFPRLLNARDLGGYAVRGGQRTRERSVLRTDDLYKLTTEGAQALVDYGVRSVIDLRWPRELERKPSVFQRGAHGVQYTHISLLDGSEETWNLRVPAVTKEHWNCAVLDNAGPEMARVLKAVAGAPQGVVLFHCAAGKDRTGVIAAMLLAAADVEPDEIAEDYSISTDYIKDTYLANYPVEDRRAVLEEVRCPPAQIYNMLAHLDRHYGGTLGYLRRIGLSATEIDRIRNRLLPHSVS